MEIVFQYTITDIRRFIGKYEYLSGLKIFSSSEYENANNTFIRSTGKRYSGGITKEFLRAVDFNSKRSVKINKWFSFCKEKEKEGIEINLLSRKFYFDQYFVSGIYEICFDVFSPGEINYESLKKLIKELLGCEIRIPKVSKKNTEKSKSDFSGKEYLRTLGNAGKAFIRHYNFATFPKKQYLDIQDSMKYVKCSEPHIFIKTDYRGDKIILPCLCEKGSDFLLYNFSLSDANGSSYNASLLHNLSGKDSKNAYKLINEIPVFRKSLYFVLDNIRNRSLSPVEKSLSSDDLQFFLIEVIKKLRDKNFVSDISSEYKGFFSQQSNLDQLKEALQTEINVRRDTFKKVHDFFEDEKEKNIINNQTINIGGDIKGNNVKIVNINK